MDRDTIIRLAREIWDTPNWNEAQTERLERFAALVAAHEREACAHKAVIALLGADRGLSYRVDQAIRSRT